MRICALKRIGRLALALVSLPSLSIPTLAQTNAPFDGRPWNISSGNLSVSYIQASPIGDFPRPDYLEPPPSVESQVHLKQLGLVANEDYVAWGAVEREPGRWDWRAWWSVRCAGGSRAADTVML